MAMQSIPGKNVAGTMLMVAFLLRSYPARTTWAMLLLLLSGLAEGVGIVALLPLFATFADETSAQSSGIFGSIRGVLLTVGLPTTTEILLAIIIAGVIIKGGLLLIAMGQVGFGTARVAADFRGRLIRALMDAKWTYFIRQSSGSLANSISSESMRASGAYNSTCKLFSETMHVMVYCGIAAMVSWYVTLAAVFFGGLMFLVLRRLVRVVRRTSELQTTLLKSLVSRLVDGLVSFKALKAMGREDSWGEILERETKEIDVAQRREVLSIAALHNASEPFLVIFLVAGFYLAHEYFRLAVSELLFVAFLFYRTVSRISTLQTAYQGLVRCQASFVSISDTIRKARMSEEEDRGVRDIHLTDSVRLENVTFAYDSTPVLQDVNINIPRGSFVSIVGPSGAGKTTIVDLVIGLLRPQSGEVWIDDCPLVEANLRQWRSRIGYVPQEMFLFHESVLTNVTLDQPGLGEHETEFALRAAGAWDFVKALPEGLSTKIGERGAMLSGGQRQRIAIARALVRRPQLLILDEPTTALDPETEASICATFRSLSGEMTVLAISHQAIFMDIADVVYKINSGTVEKMEKAGNFR